MKKNRASILLYAIFLANFAIVVAWILFSKSEILSQNIEYQNLNTQAIKDVKEKGILAIRYDRTMNSNGSGFLNTVHCPQIVTSVNPTPTPTTAELVGNTAVCSNGNISLYYDPTYTQFVWGIYGSYTGVTVGTNPFTIAFPDGTSLTGSFDASLSNIDSNLNSDDYTPYSTGTITYPNGFLDDDILARTTVYGYIKKTLDWHNVFWNNTQTNAYTAKNIYNSGSLVVPLGQVDAGYLHFDVDNPWKLRIIEFNSWSYQSSKTLTKLQQDDYVFSSGSIGWLSTTGAILPGTAAANNGLLRQFDFKNKNYAFFVYFSWNPNNSSVDFMKYKITGETPTGSGIYLVPLDDSDPNFIKYLGNDILISSQNEYISKQFEIIEPKVSGN